MSAGETRESVGGDRSWQHFHNDGKRDSYAKNWRKNFPGVHIMEANSTRQERF